MTTQSGSLQSSWIAGYEYDPGTQVLIVNFIKGGNYTLSGISQSQVDEFISAPSKGRYYNSNFK